MRFKKLLLIGVGSALAFTMGGVGTAQADTSGTTHRSTAALSGATQLVSVGGGRCAGCHRAHTAKAEYLLKQAQPGLCYTCHGGAGSTLDVVDGTELAGGGNALRGGGFAFAAIDGAKAEKTMGTVPGAHGLPTVNTLVPVKAISPVTSRHQIDGVTQGTMWGNGAVSDVVAAPTGTGLAAGKTGVTLECGSCHDPHGNGNYRILKAVPNDAATSAVAFKAAFAGSPEIADDPATTTVNEFVAAKPATAQVDAVTAVDVLPVNIPDATAKVYTTTNYWLVTDRNVPTVKGGTLPLVDSAAAVLDDPATIGINEAKAAVVGATDGYITNVAAWCTTCHTRYLAGSGSWQTPLKDAAGKVDATFTYRHRSDRTDRDGISRPNCIQCHVSHGSNVAMGGYAGSFTQPDGSTPAAGQGTAGFDPGTGRSDGAANVGTSRLLRVDNRGTCEMCHNV